MVSFCANADVAGDFFSHASGALHPLESTAVLWRDWGLRLGEDGNRIIFYCGSGWRSAVAWCLARLPGHTNCASYDGGVLEWSWVGERALESGEVVANRGDTAVAASPGAPVVAPQAVSHGLSRDE